MDNDGLCLPHQSLQVIALILVLCVWHIIQSECGSFRAPYWEIGALP